MLTLHRTLLSLLLFPLTIETVAAHDSDKQLSPFQICSRLVQKMGEDVLISSGRVALVSKDMRSIHRSVSAPARPLAQQLSKLPFGKKVLQEIPALGESTWYSWGSFVGSDMQSESGRDFNVSLSSRGIIEIYIRTKLSPKDDKFYYSQVIMLLQNEGVEAALSANTKIEPFDPLDGFDLLISRLDTNNQATRMGIAKLLTFLKGPG